MSDSEKKFDPGDEDSQLSALGRNLLGSGPSPTGGIGGTSRVRWTPPTAEELAAMLPGYEITKMLGRGGMGAVYMGRQISLDRPVAIKILSNDLVEAESGFVERFRNEARSMAKLEHPGIVAVYDFGETESGLLYIVMQFVDGTDVARMIAADGRLHTEHAMAVTAHVCDALNYAHEKGIIHRDIKPANIMVGYDGVVKVADFGLAKIHEADGNTAGLTQSGMMMGTMHYMAPEMLILGQVDQRADVYAVGVMLYHMLTGKVPHGMFELPSMQVPGLDPRYDGIIARAMREDPESRYQNSAELRSDLDAILTQPVAHVRATDESAGATPAALPTMARPQRPGGKKVLLTGEAAQNRLSESVATPQQRSATAAWIWSAAVVILAMIVGGAWWWMESSMPDQPPQKSMAETPPESLPEPDASDRTPMLEPTAEPSHEPASETPVPTTTAATDPTISPRVETPEPEHPSETPESDAPVPDTAGDSTPLASIPGFVTRLETYLAARSARFIELADKYERGLDSRLDQAADAGDLALSTAFSEEKERIAAFVAAAEALPADPFAAASDSPEIEVLPSDAPEGLATLREVWDRETEAIRFDLNGKLRLSLQLLEVELTRSREFDQAKRVMAWRKGLEAPSSSDPAVDALEVSPISASLSSATTEAPFENSLGMKFVLVPIGSGPTGGKTLLFSVWETRVQDYEEFLKQDRDRNWKRLDFLKENHPVTNVSWEDATAFCEWLTREERKTGKISNDTRYRLPSDHEWSCAVGIGDREDPETIPAAKNLRIKKIFPWGESLPPPNTAGNYCGEETIANPTGGRIPIEGFNDGFDRTSPVGSYKANSYGLYDLGGNAWEWCEDWFRIPGGEKVLRGGSWYSNRVDDLLSSVRHDVSPGVHNEGRGFRCVLELLQVEEPAPLKASNSSIPPSATTQAPFENSLGMKFVPVPNTDVLFCIHETRWRDYEAYAKRNRGIDMSWESQIYDGYMVEDDPEDHPVVNVSWDDAQKFCAWLSEKEGKTYRLPTDREWSIAVGIGDQEKWEAGTTPETVFKSQDLYPWGKAWPPPAGAGNFNDDGRRGGIPRWSASYMEGYDDGFAYTAPVMRSTPNLLGLFDMGGNVLEWCADWYSDAQLRRVARGGSWQGGSVPQVLLSSTRRAFSPDIRSGARGFRVVLETGVTKAATNPAPKASSEPSMPTTKPAPFENSLGMKFVPVPGTDVLFCIHETRRRDYEAYGNDTGNLAPNWDNQLGLHGFMIQDNPEEHPVVYVSWDDAQAFCKWLSEREGKTYRLPTDREWSIAVGIGDEEERWPDTTPSTVDKLPEVFPWGRSWPPPAGAGNFRDQSHQERTKQKEMAYLESYDDGYPTTAPVMRFEPNRFGLYDLGGNVWEWVEDWFSAEKKERVLRGGSWGEINPLLMSSSYRRQKLPDYRQSDYHGFRVVVLP